MKNSKIVLVLLLSVVVSTQAGWLNDTKNWVGNVFQKTEKGLVNFGKTVARGAEIAFNKTKALFVAPAVAPKPAKKVGPPVAPKPANNRLDQQQETVATELGQNVKILKALLGLHDRVQELLSERPDLDGMIGVQIGQMLDGFKQTNGVPVGEEEIALQVMQNIEKAFNDYERNIVSGNEVSDFIDQTFKWWKNAYWTEEIFGQGNRDYYDISDDEWEKQEDALWNDEDNDTDFEETLKIGNTMVTEEQQQVVVGALSGGLLKNKRN